MTTEKNTHCHDCCCAQSWIALGVTEYTGLSIPEHIEQLISQRNGCAFDYAAMKIERDALLVALRAAEARLDQPVLRGEEKAGYQAANILRADIRSALMAIRTAVAKATGAA
jgi:hypothetical protein